MCRYTGWPGRYTTNENINITTITVDNRPLLFIVVNLNRRHCFRTSQTCSVVSIVIMAALEAEKQIFFN